MGAELKKGSVVLVGAGCGDPEFLTQKARRVLQDCETLIFDSLVSERIIAEAPAACEKIYVGKRYGRHAMKQEEINALLIQKAKEGKRVVRLKGGDPYVFGRGGEEFMALLSAGIACETVPGITSAIAVPAAAGIPVTHRGKSRSFTVITGTTAQAGGTEGLQMDFETLARLEGTLVILMGLHHLKEIADGLMGAGKDRETPCAVIAEGTTDRQKSVRAPLFEIAERTEQAKLAPPAVIVIGAVAEMELISQDSEAGEQVGFMEENRKQISDRELLAGITVGVTGTVHFAEKLSSALREKGAAVCDMSFMEILENPEPLPDFKEYEWLVLTSPNGARIFLDKMKQERRDLRGISSNKIAVIGPGTAKILENAGIYPDYMPQTYDAAHLAEGLTERILKEASPQITGGIGAAAGKRKEKSAIFLRAAKGSEALPHGFMEKQLSFVEFSLYEIGVDEGKRKQTAGYEPDYVAFGSALGVRAFFEGKSVERENERSRYVCIGEACAAQLRQLGIENALIAPESSVQGMVDCIVADIGKEMR